MADPATELVTRVQAQTRGDEIGHAAQCGGSTSRRRSEVDHEISDRSTLRHELDDQRLQPRRGLEIEVAANADYHVRPVIGDRHHRDRCHPRILGP